MKRLTITFLLITLTVSVRGFVSEREQSTGISVETGCEVRSGAEGVVRAVLVVGVAGAHFGAKGRAWACLSN